MWIYIYIYIFIYLYVLLSIIFLLHVLFALWYLLTILFYFLFTIFWILDNTFMPSVFIFLWLFMIITELLLVPHAGWLYSLYAVVRSSNHNLLGKTWTTLSIHKIMQRMKLPWLLFGFEKKKRIWSSSSLKDCIWRKNCSSVLSRNSNENTESHIWNINESLPDH